MQKTFIFIIIGLLLSSVFFGFIKSTQASSPSAVVYIGLYHSDSDSLIAYNAINGSVIWKWGIRRGEYKDCVATPTYYEGYIYVILQYADEVILYKLDDASTQLSDSEREIWNVTLVDDGEGFSTPAISNGFLYTGVTCSVNDTGIVYCINLSNGNIIWKYWLPQATYNQPAISDGVLLIGCNDWHLYAFGDLDEYNSSVISGNHTNWDTLAGGQLHQGHTTCNYSPINATLLWTANVTGTRDEFGGPIVHDGIVYMPSKRQIGHNYPTGYDALFALYLNNGTEKWRFEDIGPQDGTPTFYNGRIFAAEYADEGSANLSGRTNFSSSGFANAVNVIRGGVFSPSKSGYLRNITFALSTVNTSDVHRFRAAIYTNDTETRLGYTPEVTFNGSKQWVTFEFTYSPYVYDDKEYIFCVWSNDTNISDTDVYYQSNVEGAFMKATYSYEYGTDGSFPHSISMEYSYPDREMLLYFNISPIEEDNLFCINATTGEEIWNVSIKGAQSGYCDTPAISEEYNSVFIYNEGNVWAFDISTGSTKWNVSGFDTGCTSPTYYDGKVYIVTKYGGVYCLDAEDGSVIWSDTENYTFYAWDAAPMITVSTSEDTSSDTFGITVTGEYIWIDITNATWALGVVAMSSHHWTNETGVTFIADMDNTTVNTDLKLQITSDATDWSAATSGNGPGADVYRLNASVDTWSTEAQIVTASATTISTDIPAGQNETFDLRFDAPTSTSTGDQQSITVTASLVKA